jgi:hypothetical protein
MRFVADTINPNRFQAPANNIRGYQRGPPAHTRHIRSSTFFSSFSFFSANFEAAGAVTLYI